MSGFNIQDVISKIKMSNVRPDSEVQMKYVLQICTSFLLASCSSLVIAENAIKTNAGLESMVQPSQKILEDGQALIRHAGDEWSRQKIRDYLSQNILMFDIDPSSLTSRMSDSAGKPLCPTLQRDLQRLNFEFIEPNIVTDDWDDPLLDKYKEKYDRFKYGMGYTPRKGSDSPTIPTWNINIYDVDTDVDGDIEVVLYGERLRAKLSAEGHLAGYLVFESDAEWQRGGAIGGYGDPSGSALDPDDYILSALIKVRNIYTVIVINDFDSPSLAERQFYVRLYFIGLQDKYRRGAAYNNYRCYYDLKPITKSEPFSGRTYISH